MSIHAAAFGLATFFALLALIPSKTEMEKDVPWASLFAAMFAGVWVIVGFSS